MNLYKKAFAILERLAEEGVDAIVLRTPFGREDIYDASHVEIDILVPEEARSKVYEFFYREKLYKEHTLEHSSFLLLDGDRKLAFDIQFDYVHAMNLRYLKYESALQFARDESGILFMDGAALAAHLIVHCIMQKNMAKDEYLDKICSLLCDDELRRKTYRLIRPIFGAYRGRKLIIAFQERNMISALERKYKSALRYLVFCPGEIPRFIAYVNYALARRGLGYRKGACVAFIGLDGVGKTTLIDSLDKLLPLLHRKTEVVYMGKARSHILPMDKIAKKVGVNAQAKTKKERSALFLLIRDLVYSLDMLLRYMKKIHLLKSKGNIVLTDRYAYDLFLDENQRGFSKWFLRKIYPKPDLLIFLTLEESEIIKRRDEYSSAKRAAYLEKLQWIAKEFKAETIYSDDLNMNILYAQNLIEEKLYGK